jgi:hypothetical protein
VGEMHRFLYHNAHNITIGEIHTNYAANKKVAAWGHPFNAGHPASSITCREGLTTLPGHGQRVDL